MDLLQSITSIYDGSLPSSLSVAIDLIGGVPVEPDQPIMLTVLTSGGVSFAVAGRIPALFLSFLEAIYDVEISSRIVSISPLHRR